MLKISCFLASPALAQRVERELEHRGLTQWVVEVSPRDASRLTGYFESEPQARQEFHALRDQVSELPEQPDLEIVSAASWQDSYRHHFHTVEVGSFTLVPSWASAPLDRPSARVVELDPKLSFGTDHPTTRLCLGALEAFAQVMPALGNATFVDAGCGSGVLGIAALKLGFRSGYAFDTDPAAVEATRTNAQRNQVRAQLICEHCDLETGLAHHQADLVFANIHHNVLVANARSLLNAVNPGGLLILSGCLKADTAELATQFQLAAERYRWPLRQLLIRYDAEWGSVQLSRC